jgi:hypothetical protein
MQIQKAMLQARLMHSAYSFLGLSTSCEPIALYQSATASTSRLQDLHLLIPHISQNTGASRNGLLFPASSAGSSVVIGWAALHVCDFAEACGVGLFV